ncbi:WbqC family protein [bacterium]|nr:WbqC family protein [bacterium]
MLVSIHQPQFFPYLGYFAKINQADFFVFLDNVQYKKNEWQNRNKIKTQDGWQWLTVPVNYKFPQKMFEVVLATRNDWKKKHLNAIKTNYSKAQFFTEIFELVQKIYAFEGENIATFNTNLVVEICNYLGIKTKILVASELGNFTENPDERLVEICRKLGSKNYLAGAGGKDYMNLEVFEKAGVTVIFQSYKHPKYTQLFGEFEVGMCILDLLFNCGKESLKILTETN